jgi:hypothetical protein
VLQVFSGRDVMDGIVGVAGCSELFTDLARGSAEIFCKLHYIMRRPVTVEILVRAGHSEIFTNMARGSAETFCELPTYTRKVVTEGMLMAAQS